jgi:hypothetical protein
MTPERYNEIMCQEKYRHQHPRDYRCRNCGGDRVKRMLPTLDPFEALRPANIWAPPLWCIRDIHEQLDPGYCFYCGTKRDPTLDTTQG